MENVINQIGKVIVGKDDVIKKVLAAIIAGGHILIEDVPGVGKTTLALALSKVLGLDYKRIQFTPDTLPSDIIGFSLYDKQLGKFTYQPGPVMSNLVLADEINRTSSKTQAALLEVMEECKATVDGKTYDLPSPFIVIATQNPVGSAGTQPLPPSQLDRFTVRLKMGYPDTKSQISILKARHTENPLNNLTPVIDRAELLKIRSETNQVYISDPIYEYITCLAEKTRTSRLIDLGISPRAAFALCNMSKAVAYIQKRSYVIPSDVKEIFTDVCAHRLILSREARISGYEPQKILNDILSFVPMPRVEIDMRRKK